MRSLTPRKPREVADSLDLEIFRDILPLVNSEPLILATVHLVPPLQIFLRVPDDALRLANATKCRVTVEYSPSVPDEPTPKASGVPSRVIKKKAGKPAGDVPLEMRRRFAAEPDRIFSSSDFVDLAVPKRIGALLFRLTKEQGKIVKVGRNQYRHKRVEAGDS